MKQIHQCYHVSTAVSNGQHIPHIGLARKGKIDGFFCITCSAKKLAANLADYNLSDAYLDDLSANDLRRFVRELQERVVLSREEAKHNYRLGRFSSRNDVVAVSKKVLAEIQQRKEAALIAKSRAA